MEETTAIAQRLESQPHAMRIKKLLLYATAGRWETDAAQLCDVSLVPMLEQLHHLYPTQQQLRFYLYTIAANLTKSREYQQIANLILLECTDLYIKAGFEQSDDEPTAFFSAQPPPPPPPAEDNPMLEVQCKIAQALELMSERDRLVKLMLCLMTDSWESNPEVLAQTSIRKLLQDIWQKYSSLIEVERQLVAIVQRLSKAVEYSSLATMIVRQIAPLYGLYQEEQADQSLPLVQSLDSFDLRLEIMKFTNPLRAKILLYSMLNQKFTGSEQDWASLKCYSLEALLKRMLSTYAAAELGYELQRAALNFDETEDYEQVIDVLMRALKLPAMQPVEAPDPVQDEEATEIRLSSVVFNTL